jgi:NADH-quinone oxidoreductase subunit N
VNTELTVTVLLQSFAIIVPEALLVLGACVLFLGGTFRAGRILWGTAALITLGLALVVFIATWPPSGQGSIDERALAAVFASPLRLDRLALYVKLVALVAGAVLVLVSWKEIPDKLAAECFACLLVVTAGLALVGSANDLMTLFLALELISIPSYVLLYLPRHDEAAQEAAMKYFLLSIFSSGLLLFGFSYMYGLTGTTNLPASAEALGRAGGIGLPPVALVALVMIIAGLGFKITAVPFHFYAPDVYQGTPATNAALLSIMPKVAGFIALLRVLAFVPLEAIGPEGPVYVEAGVRRPGLILGADGLTLLWIVSAVTMTLGNLLALLQNNLKRLLAYSSVAHAGYMLIGLAVAASGAGNSGNGISGVEAVLFYLVAYASMTLGAFGVIVYLNTPERPVETVDDLAGLSRSHPGVALLMVLFLFSLIGIPLTVGFAGKLFLFWGAMGITDQGDPTLLLQARLFRILALIGAVNAAIAAWYYLRIVGVMYLRSALRPLVNRPTVPGLVALAACGFLTLAFGVYPWPLLRAVEQAVPKEPVPVAGMAQTIEVGQK